MDRATREGDRLMLARGMRTALVGAIALVLTGGVSGAQSVPAATPLVLAPVTLTGAVPVGLADSLAARLRPLLASPALGGRASMAIVDVSTQRPVWESFGGRPVAPASVMKILTSLSVLRARGPAYRLTTRVALVHGGVIVIGAGDPSLARLPGTLGLSDGQRFIPASMKSLAVATARALRASSTTSVSVAYDASLFTGPSTALGWSPSLTMTGVVAPVSALSVDGGRLAAGNDARSSDPAKTAADAFAAQLRSTGIKVTGATTSRRSPANARILASVDSPPVSALIELMLTRSDNDIAEALARLAGVAAGDGSFGGGVTAVRTTLTALGVIDSGVVLRDGSGLSLVDRMPAQVLAAALAAAGSEPSAMNWPLWSGLAVAGATGTLADRFTGAARLGRGIVRAKTGTLSGVSNLAGVVVTKSGRLLSFAVLADRVVDRAAAVGALDRIAAELAR